MVTSRRAVLKGGCMAAASAAMHQLWAPAAAFASDGRHTLVTIFLRGGLDGLSAVVPHGDDRYFRARPGIAVRGTERLPLSRGFGLHPALAPLHELRDQLAVVHGSGATSATRSHFASTRIVDSGGEAVTDLESGWLARHLLATGATAAPLHAVSWANTPAASLAGDPRALGLGRLGSFSMTARAKYADEVTTTLRSLYGADDSLGRGGRQTLDALEQVNRLRTMPAEPATSYPTSHLGRSLAEIAHTIRADAGLVAATVDVGGWDTHTGMGDATGGRMATLLDDLGRSLHAFVADLGGRMRDVTVVTMSEFGRRVEQNGSGGVDHGRGTAMLVLGNGVRPGVHGQWVGLEEAVLDRGDVPVVNDYRGVLAEVLSRRVGRTDLAAVFPGYAHRGLGLV